MTESASYVFGPVLKLLKAHGYTEGVNLDAVPYDWRVPPTVLESRDGYFTNTMRTIEGLYRESNNLPVVLLCHSMGCKTGHYLLNFVLHRLGAADGGAWIDRHIHSYVPVGGPHLGAPKSVRGQIDGDKMGLEAFLEKDEGVLLGRSFGSVPWLFPLDAAAGVGAMPAPAAVPRPPPIPAVILRREAKLLITLPAQCLQLKEFINNRQRPAELRLAVQVGSDVVVRTDFASVADGVQVTFKESTWLVASPPTNEQTISLYPYVQLLLEEPGTGSAQEAQRGICTFDIFWPLRCLCCLIRWTLCFPCAFLWKFGSCVIRGTKKGVDKTASLLGGSRVIGESRQIDWSKGIRRTDSKAQDHGGETGSPYYEIHTKISATKDKGSGFFLLRRSKPLRLTIKAKWEPHTLPMTASALVCPSDKRLKKERKFLRRAEEMPYLSSDSRQLLMLEGLTTATKLIDDTYGRDPLGPLSLSAWQPPPVKNVVAIYGVNLPTEVSCAYRRNPLVRIATTGDRALAQFFLLDKGAALTTQGGAAYVVEDGVISETRNTPQHVIGEAHARKISGDGTVPYWSLQHCRAWHSAACDVTVHEIDGAEHRAILNDPRFHRCLLEEVLGLSA